MVAAQQLYRQPTAEFLKSKYPINSIWQTNDGRIIRILSHTDCPYWTPQPDDSTWVYVEIVRYDLWAEDFVFDGALDYYELVG